MMALSAAEKQKRYRQRRDLDPEKRNQYLLKQRQKYLDDLKLGKRKRVEDMTSREQRSKRREWKKKKAEFRKRKRTDAKRTENILTPNPSPEHMPQYPNVSGRGAHMSRQRKRNIAKCYRDNSKLREALETEKRRNSNLRKRILRIKEHIHGRSKNLTPRSKTRSLLKAFSGAPDDRKNKENRGKVKRALLFHLTLTEELKMKYRKGNNKEKRTVADILSGKLINKYKLLKRASQNFGVYSGMKAIKKRGTVTKRQRELIQNFYERDDNSRMTSGIKETLTKYKQKKQRRVMLNSINKLYQKFAAENPDINISHTSFWRCKPFWVTNPRESDRETCVCKQHDNLQYIVNTMHKSKIVKTVNLQELVKLYACDTKNVDCMYGRCQRCVGIRVNLEGIDRTELVSWFKWQNIKEKRIIRDVEKEVAITAKVEENGTIDELVDRFSSEMSRFKKHVFNIENQSQHYHELKERISPNEVLVHVDFSENYECKLAREIQSMHYGASKRQITLHTGVYYTQNKVQTFCAVSDSLDHSPAGIWACLSPILDKIFEENKDIDTIHFYSDGPSTQYKQKANFFLLSNEVESRGLKLATWNFYESGHGKGVPDGVGGSLTRTANNFVLRGHDIKDARSFADITKQQQSAVFVYVVEPVEAANRKKLLESNKLKPVPGTYKMHQLKTKGSGNVWYRDTSCTCDEGRLHCCHKWKFSKVIEEVRPNHSEHIASPSLNSGAIHEPDDELNFAHGKYGLSEQRKKGFITNMQTEAAIINMQTEAEVTSTVEQKSHDQNNLKENFERHLFFESCLSKLRSCSTYTELEKLCPKLAGQIERYVVDDLFVPSIMDTGLNVDEDAMDLYPSDTPQANVMYPIKVTADGNCLPYTGSILAFGNENHGTEIRVRIVIETVLHKKMYLTHNFLCYGASSNGSMHLPKAFAMYSDEYIPSGSFNESVIETIFNKETMKITQKNSYMGIWQIFALSSVLGRPLFSIYPDRGNTIVRNDLHRLINPREMRSACINYIMWSTTRKDMKEGHWIPNHFVAVLPIAVKDIDKLGMQRWKLVRDRRFIKERDRLANSIASSSTEDGIITDSAQDTAIHPDVHENPREQMDKELAESYIGEKRTETEEIVNTDRKPTSVDLLSPIELVGKYVLVRYNDQIYPGIVLDSDEEEVYIRCMHRVGKYVDDYSFYWPKAVKDECWYQMKDVLHVIKEPKLLNRKYYVDKEILKSALKNL